MLTSYTGALGAACLEMPYIGDMPADFVQPLAASNAALRLHPSDNIAVARASLPAGFVLTVDGAAVTARDPIPAGHKIALVDIAAAAVIFRYGQPMGRAREAIAAGSHVHLHNVAYEEPRVEYEFPTVEIPIPPPPAGAPSFLGYAREDGRVGTRNYIAVAAASNCAAHAVETIARSYEGARLPDGVDGVVAFPHGEGCGHAAGSPDIEQLRRTIAGVLDHPNVSAAIVVGLGCEDNQVDGILQLGRGRFAALTLQADGGAAGVLEAARRRIAQFIERAAAEKRSQAPLSKLVLGLNCGGSDSFSGITANPALGRCSDLLAAYGGTAVLAETPEIVGAEHLLVKRARSREVAEKLLARIRDYREYIGRFGVGFDANPAPGNKAGGITNIIEKSLGAVAKGGSSPLIEVYRYAEAVVAPGLVFMDTPGYDPVSLAGLAAGGCNAIAFTTGRGSAIGFPTVPVIKISTNTDAYRRMAAHIDIDAGAVASGGKSLDEVGREIFDLVLEAASGRRTCAERLGHREFVPWRIGPVM